MIQQDIPQSVMGAWFGHIPDHLRADECPVYILWGAKTGQGAMVTTFSGRGEGGLKNG
jgi:hypothetical protein